MAFTFFGKREARMRYSDNEAKPIHEGDFVRCAVSGMPIAVADLKYWNVERQEAYASAEIAVKRYLELHGRSAAR